MPAKIQPSTPTRPGEISSFWVFGARLTWAFVGPVALLGFTYAVIDYGNGWLTRFDAAFAFVVGLMLLSRWVEQRAGSNVTLTGEPATLAQFKKYMVILLAAAAALWVTANLFGNHVLD